MPTPEPFTRGSLRFEATWERTENNAAVAMFEVDCYKPPLGTIKNLAWPKTIDLVFEPGFMHKAELERLLAGARQQSDASFGVSELLHAIQELADSPSSCTQSRRASSSTRLPWTRRTCRPVGRTRSLVSSRPSRTFLPASH